MLKLEQQQTNRLLSQPESGMGFQMVDVTMADQRVERGVVYNADLLFFDKELKERSITESYERLLNEARSAAGMIREIRVVQPPTTSGARRVSESRSTMGQKPGPAKDAPKEKTQAGEVFMRFTAFANDRRVRPDRSWSPGTYATTEADARNVRTGRDAVARYALPNPAPASYRFTGKPHGTTVIQRGIVEPAFGQPGGGVEVIFPDGTQPATVTGPDKIPD